MARITDEMVSIASERIGQATDGVTALSIAMEYGPEMLNRIGDLNHVDVTQNAKKYKARHVVEAHGWDPTDSTPPVMENHCSLGRFEAHSRRPWECRACGLRRIDHRCITGS